MNLVQTSRSSKTFNKSKAFHKHGKHKGMVTICLMHNRRRRRCVAIMIDPREFFERIRRGRC